MTPAGVLTEFPLSLPPGVVPGLVIVPGPDGALWFTATTGLYRVTTAGVVSQVLSIPIPAGFAWGPDGRVWFGDSSTNSVKAVDVGTGTVSSYVLPAPNSSPGGITPGPDGALWFLELSTTAQKIGRVTTTGALTEYPIPAGGNLGLSTMTVGPDGNMWFTEPRIDRVARITVPAFPPVPRASVILAPRRPEN